MKGVLQRVTKASVEVDGQLVSSIGRGLCILIGIHKDDSIKDKEYLAQKVLSVRLWDDENGRRWARSVKDMQYEILCVSQFTLYHTLKGNKPDFRAAMPSSQSQEFYHTFLETLKRLYDPSKIKDGQFGAMMQVHIQNDGPVTIELETPSRKHPEESEKMEESERLKAYEQKQLDQTM